MTKVYIVFSSVADPYAGGPYIEFIYSNEDVAKNCVENHNFKQKYLNDCWFYEDYPLFEGFMKGTEK